MSTGRILRRNRRTPQRGTRGAFQRGLAGLLQVSRSTATEVITLWAIPQFPAGLPGYTNIPAGAVGSPEPWAAYLIQGSTIVPCSGVTYGDAGPNAAVTLHFAGASSASGFLSVAGQEQRNRVSAGILAGPSFAQVPAEV